MVEIQMVSVTRFLTILACICVIALTAISVSLSKFEGSDEIKTLNAVLLPQNDESSGLSFIISSYDHFQDLSKVDFADYAYVQLDDGPKIKAYYWLPIQTGHHLRGKLYFPTQPINQTKTIKLIIDSIGTTSEELFIWPMNFNG
jgi:hypothetical protein